MNSCDIATARKLKKWDYLEKMSKKLRDNEDISVDLLIGANCLEALEPGSHIKIKLWTICYQNNIGLVHSWSNQSTMS